MEILSFNTLPSTQRYLIEGLRRGSLKAPVAVIADQQTKGIGSRDNEWSGGRGNFFASIALSLEDLPEDLPLGSASIYFSFVMKKLLGEFDKNIWLKWPNDFYKSDQKVGGTITQKVGNILVCGIGINLKNAENGYKSLQCELAADIVLEKYISALEKVPKWKQVFREYEIEFELSRKFSAHVENRKVSLEEAVLLEDGSLLIEEIKVYSLR